MKISAKIRFYIYGITMLPIWAILAAIEYLLSAGASIVRKKGIDPLVKKMKSLHNEFMEERKW